MATHWRSRPPDDDDEVVMRPYQELEVDKWRIIFDKYDEIQCGEITVWALKQLLQDPEFREMADPHVLHVLQMKCTCNRYTYVTYQEFVNIMSNRRTSSFRLAVENEGRVPLVPIDHYQYPYNPEQQPVPNTLFKVMVKRVAREYLTDDLDRQYYADNYTCCPPPLFVPIITFVEVGCFLYHSLDSGRVTVNGPLPVTSVFIYRPDRRIEIWRFVLYMFIHAGWVHLFFNMLIQIIVGVPLEMVHGSCRIAVVYFAGVLAGSLGTSIFDMNAVLVGASGGVYALLAGHLANVVLNYTNMELGILKLAAIFMIASADVGFAVWDRYTRKSTGAPPVGYTAHIMGALAGLTIGLVVLKNFEQKLHEHYLWWIALAAYLGYIVFAIFWNIFYY
ncbi:rhomboid-related protein 3-like isoform X1 [Mercenaria mercenaria]|uniref:rhomboid-related protein 3-like isoform X1 n=2 Tax=Mercenaria mercenaria TaxID=6596 RepID=UPI00234E4E8D|nr:rhomboid-related protein 3-like isoform X1 [Mercenaria mercenaria]